MIDRQRLEAAVRETLAALGEDPTRAGLVDTPRRVADAWEEFYAGSGFETKVLPDEVAETRDVVVVSGIDFVSICEHHLLPFSGVAHVAYQPATRLIGLSDIPRMVGRASAGLHLQEELTRRIVEDVHESASARGVLVVVQARHGCVSDRGVRQAQVNTVTVGAAGTLDSPAARSEILHLLDVARHDPTNGVERMGSATTGELLH